VRQFCKRRIADLIDSRDPQLLAGIVSDLRIINGQRGRVGIFKLDDKSEPIEAVANEELLDANKELLRDDELIIVQGKAQPDRFSGGLRLNVQQVWSLAGARPASAATSAWPARHGAGGGGAAARASGARGADGRGRPGAGPGGAGARGTAPGRGRGGPGRAGPLLAHQRGAGRLEGAGR
jgi:hypothetical protein